MSDYHPVGRDMAVYERGRKDAFKVAAKCCEKEAEACLADIVPGDELGAKLAHARVSALLTAADDIREME